MIPNYAVQKSQDYNLQYLGRFKRNKMESFFRDHRLIKAYFQIDHSLEDGSDIHSLDLRQKSHPNIRRLSQRRVFSMRVEGDCCWKIFGQPLFRGPYQVLLPGKAWNPNVQPRSAKKISC